MSTRSRGASSFEYVLLLVAVMVGGAAALRMLGRSVAARTLQAARVLDGEEARGSGEGSGGSSGPTRGVTASNADTGGGDGVVRPRPRPTPESPPVVRPRPRPTNPDDRWPVIPGTTNVAPYGPFPAGSVVSIELHVVGDATPGGMDRAGIVAANRVLQENPDIQYVDLVVYGRQSDGVLIRTSGGWTRASMEQGHLDDGALVSRTPPYAAGALPQG